MRRKKVVAVPVRLLHAGDKFTCEWCARTGTVEHAGGMGVLVKLDPFGHESYERVTWSTETPVIPTEKAA